MPRCTKAADTPLDYSVAVAIAWWHVSTSPLPLPLPCPVFPSRQSCNILLCFRPQMQCYFTEYFAHGNPDPGTPKSKSSEPPRQSFFFPVLCICICIVRTTTSSILRAVRALGFQPPKVASFSFAAAHFSIAHVFTLTIVVYDSMR